MSKHITQSLSQAQRKLYGKGLRVADLIRETGLPTLSVYRVMSGRSQHVATQRAIADHLGFDYEDLFGENTHPALRGLTRKAGAA